MFLSFNVTTDIFYTSANEHIICKKLLFGKLCSDYLELMCCKNNKNFSQSILEKVHRRSVLSIINKNFGS